MLKSAASGLMLTIYNQFFFRSLIVYFVHIQNLFLRDHIHQFLLQVCAQESKNQIFCFKHSIEYA